MPENTILTHISFLQSLLNHIYHKQEKSSGEIVAVRYEKGSVIRVCPEPHTFLDELDDFANDKLRCAEKFLELSQEFQKVELEPPGSNWLYWFNTTVKGINLRPGLLDGVPTPVVMGDTAVHGLMAGQTGSGKSVLLNNLIFNALAEYPPWELDLYLADFKRVEFSRYMNQYETPHVCACAATGEIRYVLSLIQYLVDCMNAREDFFARMGIDKISTFREKYPNIVLPRILLIVDEFQQLFLEASNRESEIIRQLLTAIVKKGRATGLHILFASQEMTQTLSRSDLANFRIRFALNCSVNVSMDVLGNRAASRIAKGTVLVNQEDGSEERNLEYKVPFIEAEKIIKGSTQPYFYEFLKMLKEAEGYFHFEKPKKFYKEEMQEPMEVLEDILGRICEYRKRYYTGENKYFEVLTLGNYVTYTNLRYDIQTLFIEYGRNKNIFAISPKIDDLAYLGRLLWINFDTSPRNSVIGADYIHEIYSFHPLLQSIMQLEKMVGQTKLHTNPEDLYQLESRFAKLRVRNELFVQRLSPMEYVIALFRKNVELNRRNLSQAKEKEYEEQWIPAIRQVFSDITIENLPQECTRILQEKHESPFYTMADSLLEYHRYLNNPNQAFPPTVYWICGVESVERIPSWLLWMMKNGLDYNILFILMASSEFEQMSSVVSTCDYYFAAGNNSHIYDRLRVNFTHKAADSIVLDLYIKSAEEERSFKKYKYRIGKSAAPSIPFDELLV